MTRVNTVLFLNALRRTKYQRATLCANNGNNGTWKIYGYVDFALAAATTTIIEQGLATTTNSFTNSLQTQDTSQTLPAAQTTATITLTGQPTPLIQITVASGTQVIYLVAQATFSAGAVTAYGSLYATQTK